LGALERTLLSRLNDDAPEKSYTKRLFSDDDLLSKKIMEEASELCAAETKDDIAFEAADLIYFALVKCIKNGVRLKDVENALDTKALKVTRRKGDAKPNAPQPPTTTNGTNGTAQPSHANTATNTPHMNGVNGITPTTNGVHAVNGVNGHLRSTPPQPSAPISAPNLAKDAPSTGRISMRSVLLSDITPEKREALLQRPVLKSEAMIPKVQPIVNQVREKGDSALRELTAKFDRANLDQVIIRPPFFNPNSTKCLDGKVEIDLDPEVRKAIDTAYGNVRQFHAAQVGNAPLVVETMPGVVCQRFAKPISRVGLYVPGGTAILPSTALMLGIPAQVAGCKEIVVATPPRPDGTISPEVLYVAHIVGATGLLKSGGAQAVAALAYGTETVPKVDKIFGPGNQWVTAAKMLVQMDSDAHVAIDMPAGPSEVLVSIHWNTFVSVELLTRSLFSRLLQTNPPIQRS
jgi:phosphoribosyl-ATP pyrophosphohydrolase/phosphoribosyl-AMP cyclohydrolase/histidinol dehydrogenase